MVDVVLKYFETPDEVRTFDKGRFEIVHVGGLALGRAIYQPGWRWSVHVGPTEHVGMVLSGVATAALSDGRVIELRPGALFHIPAEPHDSWVVGDEPYVSCGCQSISDRDEAVAAPAHPQQPGTRWRGRRVQRPRKPLAKPVEPRRR
jgi:quercetin dioxygenase-like cupin family protein